MYLFKSAVIDAHSAGIAAKGLDPLAVTVMAESRGYQQAAIKTPE